MCSTSLQLGIVLLLLACLLHPARGHGYLSSPRSRNLLAFQETDWSSQSPATPEPETCPHCINRGGTLARCGLIEDPQGIRNYDSPKNVLGGPMPPMIQATYTQGQEVVLDVALTAHHKGHFVFSACPISYGQVPSQACFDQYKLTFVEDLLHGANFDPSYPERAYLAPVSQVDYQPDITSNQSVMNFSFKMRLPEDLYGDLVLIQWYYLTANSCYHPGYQQYNWPAGWGGATSSMPCVSVSPDGTGAPEQFWNCAEVRINASPSPPAPAPASGPSPADTSSGIAIPVGLPSQGNGNGNRPSSAGSHGKTIVGYYASWQWYDRNKKAAPENMDFSKVQRVNFAFFQINEQGDMWGTDSWGDPNVLFGPYNWNPSEGSKAHCSWDSPRMKNCKHHDYEKGLIHLVHAAGAEIYPSLGGWTLSDPFPAMAASAAARATFAQNCVDLIRDYNFDGIDIDWEYPGFPDHSGTPQDRDNFKLLLDDVRAKLTELGRQTGKFYGLTAALPCGPRHLANLDIAHVANTLSELNLMTYDFHGSFSATTGINAPLYHQGWGGEDFDVHSCVENWLAGGGSRDKINIGLPFYGRSFAGATGLNEPHKGADQGAWGIDDGTPQYFNIVAKLSYMTSVWDPTTWTPYAYFENGGLVSYDDENAICAKVQYAQEHNLGGFIIWELSGDLMEDLSTPLLDVTNKKLLDPTFNCGEPGYYPEATSPQPGPTPATPGVLFPTSPVAMPPSSPGTFPSLVSILAQTTTSSTSTLATTSTTTSQPPPLSTNASPSATGTFSTTTIPPPSTTETFATTATVAIQSISTTTQSTVAPYPNNPSPSSPFEPTHANNQPTHGQQMFIECGPTPGSFDAEGSKPLDLSFRYELHRDSDASLEDATAEFRRSLMDSIAGRLQCAGSASVGRRLQRSSLEASRENVMAIQSAPTGLSPDPCSIEVVISNAECRAAVESLILHVRKDTPDAVARDIAEDLLFFVRTQMAAGAYDSDSVKRVIYIDRVGPQESNVASSNTNIESQPQADGGNSSSAVAIVLGLIIVVLVGVLLFVVVSRRRKRDKSRDTAEEQARDEIDGPANSEATTSPASATELTTEEVVAKALVTDEAWRKALNTYEGTSSQLSVSTDEVPGAGANTGQTSADPPAKTITGDIEMGKDEAEQSPEHWDQIEPDDAIEQEEPPGNLVEAEESAGTSEVAAPGVDSLSVDEGKQVMLDTTDGCEQHDDVEDAGLSSDDDSYDAFEALAKSPDEIIEISEDRDGHEKIASAADDLD